MNNFWIAGLEYAGVLTHEQAEDLANNIKNSIHNERYSEASKELRSILDAGPGKGQSVVDKLLVEVQDLKQEVEDLKAKKVLPKSKA